MNASIQYILRLLWAGFWVFYWKRAQRRFSPEMLELEERQVASDCLLPLGLDWMERTHWSLATDRNQKRLERIRKLVGERNAISAFTIREAYRYAVLTLCLAALPALTLFDFSWVLLDGVLIAYCVIGMDAVQAQRARQAEQSILVDLPEVLVSGELLLHAGFIPDEVWEIVSRSGTGPLYRHMQAAIQKVASGTPRSAAYQEMADAIGLQPVQQFCSFFSQNVTRGSRELLQNLRTLRTDVFRTERHRLQEAAQRASEKMLIPSLMLFSGTLLLVIVPLLMHAFSGTALV